jgi:predicted nucleotide-binding protein
MARISLIDDDASLEALADRLSWLGHDVLRYATADQAFSATKEIAAGDLAVVDIIMPSPASRSPVETQAGRRTGAVLIRELLAIRRDLRVLALSATNDPELVACLEAGGVVFYSKWSASSLDDLVQQVSRLLPDQPAPPKPRPFIVHGHDEASKLALKNYLQNVLGLPEPIILHEQPNGGRTVLEKFEHYAAGAQLAFVLLTPDDRSASGSDSPNEKRRARQNVILELGYFLAKLSRPSGRVVLLHKGALEIPSDISGLSYIDIGAGIEAAGEAIRREVSDVV